jgi:hypothetical protein
MTLRLSIVIVIVFIFAAACQSEPPQKIIEIEVTRVVVITSTEEQSTGPVPVENGTIAAQNAEATETATSTPIEASSTPDMFPTPIVGQIFLAEQDFQNAKMFWLQPIKQIWILMTDETGKNIWIVREDTFAEGLPENDPSLTPPAAGLIQPIRGFGVLWRSDDTLRSQIGWATDEELGYTTNYEYHWGGTVNENNEYVPGPGYHLLEAFNQDSYRFDEGTRTWEVIPKQVTATPESTKRGN